MSSGQTKDFLRFKEKFDQNLLNPQPSLKIIEWQEQGLLKKYLKPLDKCVGVNQDDKFHVDDVFQHCIKTCDNVPVDYVLRWAAVLHDIGKAKTRDTHILCNLTYPEEKKVIGYCKLKERRCFAKCEHAIIRVTFYRHEIASERLAKIILRLYRINRTAFYQIIDLISNHMYNYDWQWSDKAMSRFIKKVKLKRGDLNDPESFPLFRLRIADRISRGLEPITQKQQDFENRMKEHFEKEAKKSKRK
jgi:hypothetical protein